ncbi:VanW family protein [Candidatus Gottesmanbacteria bacterium]|nr:VanW family protein [Candidatus Gottesmanbacteria bacterium]
MIIIFLILYLLFGGHSYHVAFFDNKPLAIHEFSLNNRYKNSYVNNVFKDNVLLAIKYTTGVKINPKSIDWNDVEAPFIYKMTLKPGEVFAFHDDVLPQYSGKVIKTTNAHFNFQEGFKSDGYLVGDGVCHLASLLYWVATDAGLSVYAPTSHNFAQVPEVPKEFGVSIYNYPGRSSSNRLQNLYITNNKNRNIAFEFRFSGEYLKISALESLSTS